MKRNPKGSDPSIYAMKKALSAALVFEAIGAFAMNVADIAPDGVFDKGDVVLFVGDSITHGGRMGDMNHYLGHGYQAEIASRYIGYRPEMNLCFFNRGISGDNTVKLLARWEKDVLGLCANENGWAAVFPERTGVQKPDVVSLMTGVNDFRSRPAEAGPGGITLERYAANLEKLIVKTRSALPDARIVICEPFNLVAGEEDEFAPWRKAARDAAARHGLCFVDFQRLFDDVLLKENPNRGYWFWDRYHPTYAAHIRMADWWLDEFKAFRIKESAAVCAFASVMPGCMTSSTGCETACDIVIYGSTPAAIAAAVQARRMGHSAVIVSPETRIGGLTTGGLGQTDIGSKSAFGGIALEFYKAIASYYADRSHWTRQTPESYFPDGQCAGSQSKESMWTFEPSAALAVLEGWERRDGLDIRRGEWLDREKGVKRKDGRIASIKTLSGNVYRGKVFIDATYEGDLMAAAGVPYAVGREANSVYGETISGVQFREAKFHQLKQGVSPYVVEGDPQSGLLPGVEPYNPDEKNGDGDRRVQAYCFRMCLTDDPENRILFAKPANYDEREYELLFRNFAKGEVAIPWINSKMPNRKTDTNNCRGFSTDFIGRNYEWPEASYGRRAEIFKAHLDYQRGLMWTLANHPRVPEKIRAEVSRWGTCKDEFKDGAGDGWQSQLYVREARRMVGDYVMTEHECRGDRKVPHPVAMGAYTMDSHNVRRVVTANGNVQNEGDVEDHGRYSAWGSDAAKRSEGGRMKPYGIDYGSITPKRGDCENLLVPVCLSASHIAFGSIRMEPVFFALGQVAGTAAAMAAEMRAAVQDVPYEALSRRLLADGQVLATLGGRPGSPCTVSVAAANSSAAAALCCAGCIALPDRTAALREAAALELAGWKGETVSFRFDVASEAGGTYAPRWERAPSGWEAKGGLMRGIRYLTKVHGTEYAFAPDRVEWNGATNLPPNGACIAVGQVRIPASAKAGDYEMSFGGRAVRLHVVDRTLPPPSEWRTFVCDYWHHPWALARVTNTPLWSKEHFDAMRPFMAYTAAIGLRTIMCTICDLPWNHQCYDPNWTMIRHIRNGGRPGHGGTGKWSFDYTVFDKWVEFNLETGNGPYIYCYSLCPWDNELWYHDESGRPWHFNAKPGTKEYEEYWTPFLVDFRRHLIEKGWFDKVYIAADERAPEELKASIDLIRRVAPDFQVCAGVNGDPALFKDFKLGATTQSLRRVDDAFLERARRMIGEGRKVLFYVCCGPAAPNTFIASDPDDAFWLPLFAAAKGLSGFSRWTFDSFPEDAMKDATYSCWPSGDTFFVYPNGDPSWRYLNLLNGYQNSEKWRILEAEGGVAAAELERLGRRYDVKSALEKKDGDFRELVRDTLKALNRD